MATADVYNIEGQKTGTVELNAQLFDVEACPVLIHQAVVAQQANARKVLAHTMGRSDIRGGGKKPWKQKGTGRARHGSIRSPLWRGGGVTFGPTKWKNFSKSLNKKMKRRALLGTLTDKARNKKIIILEDLRLDAPKTRALIHVLDKLPSAGKKVMIALPGKNENVMHAVKNIEKAFATEARNLNVKDVLAFEYLILPKASLDVLDKTFV